MDSPVNGRLLNIISFINSPFIVNMNLNRDNILNRSFNDQGNTSHPTDDKFVESLEKVTFTEDSEICCGICLEEFKKGDEAFVLPCSDQKHYFHVGDDKETCEGILPWLKENNSCPICREKFPEKEDEENINDEENSDIPVPENDFDGEFEENLINDFLQGITIQEEEDEEEEYENNDNDNNNENNNNENNNNENNNDENNNDENNNEVEENNINTAIDNFLENILMNNINANVPRIRIISNIVNHSEDDDFELQQAIQRSLQER